MAAWAPPCDLALDELIWSDLGDAPAAEEAWSAALPGARSFDLDLECPLDLGIGMVPSLSVQASTSSADTSGTPTSEYVGVDADSATEEAKAVVSSARHAVVQSKRALNPVISVQPAPPPRPITTHAGIDVRMKRKRNCHFCGYKRGNLGPLLNCELCSNVFHSDCFMGRGISETPAKYCTRCSNLCCCGGAHAVPGANELFSKKNVYKCIGKCCKACKSKERKIRSKD